MADGVTNRAGILSAVVAVLSSQGSDGLTIRTVAAAAGVSVGAVQHHFPTKEALVVGAMTAVNERFRDRMRARLASEPSAAARLRAFCLEIACVAGTDEELSDAVVWTAFAARASTNERVRAIHRVDWARTEEVVLALLADAHPDAGVTADDAALVLAVTDGVAVARAAEQSDRLSAERATRMIDGVLASIAARARRGDDPAASD